jgi:hypothetical protein
MFSQVAHDTVSAVEMGHLDAGSYAASPCWGWGRLKSIGSTGVLPSNPTTTSRATIPRSQSGQSPTTVALLADARPSHLLPVPALVDRAAPSGVVPGELGGAAVLGAGSGLAEGADHRSGAGGAASAIASRHSHAWIVPLPKQGKRCSASPYPPVGSLWSYRVGCRLPGSSARVVLSAVVGLGWLGVARKGSAHRGRRGRPPGQPRSADRSRGAGSGEPARSAAVDPGPGAGLAVTELLARVAGSSVSLNCPGADQGGRHVDMVVGADHRGRAGVGVWRDPASPLTLRRQRPGHG